MKVLLLIAALLVVPFDAKAVDPSEILKDPTLEIRARAISKGLRCVVCQNQSIDDSDAQLARDLRVLVRDRIIAGDSDGDVIEYVVSRYGDFVLLRPPVKGVTMVLWLGPVVIALIGLGGLVLFFRRQKNMLPN
jgi:cytochrome c-type biogenesis protein CcmH